MPFRTAYKIVGQLVAFCIAENKTLETLTINEYKQFSEDFDEGVYGAIDLLACLERRTSYGGTSSKQVDKQIEIVKKQL